MQREEQVIIDFSQIASGILLQYTNEVKARTAARGEKPSFEELMANLKQMEKTLTSNAIKFAESIKKEAGNVPQELADRLKEITTSTIQKFVKTL